MKRLRKTASIALASGIKSVPFSEPPKIKIVGLFRHLSAIIVLSGFVDLESLIKSIPK